MSKTTKKQVLENISSQLKSIRFSDRIPDRQTMDESVLKKIASYFGKNIITHTIVGEVIGDYAFQEVLDKTKHDDPKTKGIVKFANFPNIDIDSITKSVYDYISKLPEGYYFILKSPKTQVNFPKVAFAHGVELLVLDDDKITKLAGEKYIERGLSRLLADFRRDRQLLKSGDVVLVIKGRGYVGKYGVIKLNIDPLYTFKVILGIYIALGIIQRSKDSNYLKPVSEYYYDVYDTHKEQVRTLSESTEDAQYLSRMEFGQNKFELSDLDKLMKKTTSEFEDANQIIKNLFKQVRFAKGNTDKNVIRRQRMIKNGAYWYYECLKTVQDHIRAIYLTTAFDSLLELRGSDDTKENKAEVISNCIAKNILEADGIKHAIKNLYILRNEIVHGEKEISSLEKYSDWGESKTQTTVLLGMSYLSRFLLNRIHFINNGLAIVIKSTAKK